MKFLVAALLLLAAGSGLGVVVSRVPTRQIFALAANSIVLSLLFFALRAPDVALSELAVGTAATPLLFLVATAVIRMGRKRKR